MVDHKQAAEGCTWPIALDDLALIAAIDGEAGPEVMAHLRDCPYCSERAHVFDNMQGLLRKQLFRMFCPTSEELAAYQQGLLKGGQQALITFGVIVANATFSAHHRELVAAAAAERVSARTVLEP